MKDLIPGRSSCTVEIADDSDDVSAPASSTDQPVSVKKIGPSQFYPDLSLFSPVRNHQDAFIEAARENDIDSLIPFSLDGLELQDFERAFDILDRANPAWRTLPATNMTRAYMTGLENEIAKMMKQAGSSAP